MVIHVIGTVNGQVNEGMRNVATHLAKEFEKDNTVLYSGLKQIPQIVLNSRRADATMIFARANKLVYSLASIVTKMCRSTWIGFGTEAGFGFHGEKQQASIEMQLPFHHGR